MDLLKLNNKIGDIVVGNTTASSIIKQQIQTIGELNSKLGKQIFEDSSDNSFTDARNQIRFTKNKFAQR
ncbi:MAG: hypothetical protein ABIH59_00710 [archaeon]